MIRDLRLESDRLILRVLDESYAEKILDFFIRIEANIMRIAKGSLEKWICE